MTPGFKAISAGCLSIGLGACDVESQAGPGTGLGDSNRTGVAVLNSDYASTSISLVARDGRVLSPLFISSGSQEPGLSAALSGDVVLPSGDANSEELVLIDRSNAALTWIDLRSAAVRAQLDVGTGFNANPHDYVAVSERKAYVTRFAGNGVAGSEPHDGGSDLLVIDPIVPEITGRIDLGSVVGDGFEPSADRTLLVAGRVHLLLGGFSPDFSEEANARIVSVDIETDAVSGVLELPGLRNCGALAVAPDQSRLALACHGFFRQEPSAGWPDSGVVIISLAETLTEEARIGPDELAHCSGGECQNTQANGLTFIDDDRLLVTTFGADAAGAGADVFYPDQAIAVSLRGGDHELLFNSGAFELGAPACFNERCFLPDAGLDGGALRTVDIATDGSLSLGPNITVDSRTGLPPRQLQRF